MSFSLKRHYIYGVLAAWALACLAFFLFCYPYHFFYQEQNQVFLLTWSYVASYGERNGWLARLAGDFLTQFYYYLYLGPVILTLCLLVMGDLLRRILQLIGLRRNPATWLAIIGMTIEGIFFLRAEYRLSSLIGIIGWLAGAWMVAWLVRKKRLLGLLALPVACVACWWCFSTPQLGKIGKPDFILEKNFAVDNEYYWGHYNQVEQLVEQSAYRTDIMMFFYNLVQAQKGQLPDKLLKYSPHELGTFYQIGPETPRLIINNMNELYWALGDMTFTERAALMNSVFSQDNRNARMMKRLAECNLVSGDIEAANKYLGILDHTLAYRHWAANMRQNHGVLLEEKRQMRNQKDTLMLNDNAHNIMTQLLDSNPKNTVALDYMLCSLLLLRDIEGFKRDYDRYCMSQQPEQVKPLYQQALCIWLAGTQAPPDEWSRYIKSPEVMQRFADYNRQRGSSRFKDTYWYYFDKTQARRP